jgi:hypothetical protein
MSTVPPAPWRSDVDALVWWHPAAEAARAALPAALAGRATLPLTLGGLIAYRTGPVGPYREIFGCPLLLRRGPGHGHVAFMAVDSTPSATGGRANWALPKEAAAFAGRPGRPGIASASGEGWALTVGAAARPRELPAWGAGSSAQVWPDGAVRAFRVSVRGRARLATADVRHDAASDLAAWLLPGRHPALLLSGRQVVGPPR